jgi:hypothetical protein
MVEEKANHGTSNNKAADGSACSLLRGSCLMGLLSDPEDGSSTQN